MKFVTKNLNCALLFIVCFLFFASSAVAQEIINIPKIIINNLNPPTTTRPNIKPPLLNNTKLPSANVTPTLSLTSDPITPLSNSIIAVAANIFGTINVKNSIYNWFLNGAKQPQASGLNKNTFSFKTGPIGTVYRVDVTATTPNGKNISDAMIFTVSDIDLSWNASNKVPADYRGKILPTKNSIVEVSALPFIYRPGTKTLTGSNNLMFRWFINDKVQSDKSGIGKSELNFRIDSFPGSDIAIRLEIMTENKAIDLNRIIVIPVIRPQTLIYLSDSKTTLPYGKALKNLIIESTAIKSLNFSAENYFFNFPKNQLKWNWLVNNKEIAGGGDKPWSAVLNVPSGVALPFSFQIKAGAKSPQNNLESAGSTANLEIK